MTNRDLFIALLLIVATVVALLVLHRNGVI